MEANPEQSEIIAEQAFEHLISYATNKAGKIKFEFQGDVSAYEKADFALAELEEYFDEWIKLGLITHSKIELNGSAKIISTTITLHEPAFSNYTYGHAAYIKDRKIADWLVTSKYTEPISLDKIYACSLMLKNNTSDIYLTWSGGEEILYHFGNMDSNRYKFFSFLTQHTDTIHTLSDLKAQYAVNQSTAKLHEYFSKTFVTGLMKDKFAIITERERIGLKSVVQLTGKELLTIIRNNLNALEVTQKRRFNYLAKDKTRQ